MVLVCLQFSQNKNVKIIDVCKKLKAILNSKSKIVKKTIKIIKVLLKGKKLIVQNLERNLIGSLNLILIWD